MVYTLLKNRTQSNQYFVFTENKASHCLPIPWYTWQNTRCVIVCNLTHSVCLKHISQVTSFEQTSPVNKPHSLNSRFHSFNVWICERSSLKWSKYFSVCDLHLLKNVGSRYNRSLGKWQKRRKDSSDRNGREQTRDLCIRMWVYFFIHIFCMRGMRSDVVYAVLQYPIWSTIFAGLAEFARSTAQKGSA